MAMWGKPHTLTCTAVQAPLNTSCSFLLLVLACATISAWRDFLSIFLLSQFLLIFQISDPMFLSLGNTVIISHAVSCFVYLFFNLPLTQSFPSRVPTDLLLLLLFAIVFFLQTRLQVDFLVGFFISSAKDGLLVTWPWKIRPTI